MQTILGANGNIGRLLAKELKQYGSEIRLVSRHPVKVNDTDILFPADLRDPMAVDKAVAGSAVVYLVVGFTYNLREWKSSWPLLMRAVLDACAKHGSKLVFFDNVYSYALSSIPNMTETALVDPPSEKGIVRKLVLDMLLEDMRSGRVEALVARSADFYGPNVTGSMLTELAIKNMQKGKRPGWFINPNYIHSFTYTPDAARGTAILGNTAAAFGQTWHLPTSEEKITAGQLIHMLSEEMKKPDKIQVMPKWMIALIGLFIPTVRELKEMLYQYDRDYFFDSTKFNQFFSYTPVSYQEGIRQIVATL